VIQGQLPLSLQESADMYAGCVAGALQRDDYLKIIKQAGFKNIKIKTSKSIELPDDVLRDYLSAEAIAKFRKGNTGIFSITVVARK
jgi:arsenite methyltransferase